MTRDEQGRFVKRMKAALRNSMEMQLELMDMDKESVSINQRPARQRAGTYRRSYNIMAATITVVGNLVADPELRETNNGKSVINFALAYTPRKPDGTDGQTSFYDIVAWEYLADNIAASVKKGDRLLVVGRVAQQKWEDADGKNRSKLVITADEVAGTMRFHTIEMNRTAKRVVEEPTPGVEAEKDDIFS